MESAEAQSVRINRILSGHRTAGAASILNAADSIANANHVRADLLAESSGRLAHRGPVYRSLARRAQAEAAAALRQQRDVHEARLTLRRISRSHTYAYPLTPLFHFFVECAIAGRHLYIYMYVCVYVCMYVCIYVCMYVFMYVNAPKYVCIYVPTYVCIYVYICVCLYVCLSLSLWIWV